MSFEDHFSGSADRYARFRPRYPDSLIDFLANASPGRDLAWDAGTGSGQAAVQLAPRFSRVVATDASREQLDRAPPAPGVEYRHEPAEAVSVPSGSVDLITVAAAVHWFDLDRFYAEVRRVLRPDGLLAVWGYHFPVISPEIDRLVERYSNEVIGPYWPAGARLIHDRYRSLPFPFAEIPVPSFHIESRWNLGQLAGFLGSWSGAVEYRKELGREPLDEVASELRAAWGNPTKIRLVGSPLFVRAGRPLPASSHDVRSPRSALRNTSE